MAASTVGVGILSLPQILASLGLIPGIILIVFFSVLSWYTGILVGQFKLRYPQVQSMSDAGAVLFGRIGREVLFAGQTAFLVLSMGSLAYAFSVAMNAITQHALCTVYFKLMGTGLFFLLTLHRNMKKLSYVSCTPVFVSSPPSFAVSECRA